MMISQTNWETSLDYKKKLSYVLMKIYEKTEIPLLLLLMNVDLLSKTVTTRL